MAPYSISVSLRIWLVRESMSLKAQKYILPRRQGMLFTNAVTRPDFVQEMIIVPESKVSSLFSPAENTKIEPTLVFIFINLTCSGPDSEAKLFASDVELDTVCRIFNDKVFPKGPDGKRVKLAWKGQGKCEVVGGRVKTYGVGVQFVDARGARSTSASRRASAESQGSTLTTTPPTSQHSKLRFWASRSTASAPKHGHASVTAQPNNASSSSDKIDFESNSRRPSVASVTSRTSIGSLCARPAPVTMVVFSVKRFGVFWDVQRSRCAQHRNQGPSTGNCQQCSYVGKLGFEVTAHATTGQELGLEPLVVEKALDAALENGIQGVLEGNILRIKADLDNRDFLKALYPRTGKWEFDTVFGR